MQLSLTKKILYGLYAPTVAPAGGGTAPTITTATLDNATIGAAGGTLLEATGDAPITWSIESGAPDGLAIDGDMLVYDDISEGGVFASLVIRATNAEGFDEATFTLNVLPAAVTVGSPTANSDVADTTPTATLNETLTAVGATLIRWQLLDSDDNLVEEKTSSATNGDVTFSALTTLRAYKLQARSENAAGNSAYSSTVTFFLVQTTGNQTHSANLLTNPSFATWSDAHTPTGWSVNQGSGPPDPELTQVDSGQLHGGTSGTGGSANFFSSGSTARPIVSQNVRTIGRLYEFETVVSALGSKLLDVSSTNGYVFATGTKRGYFRATSAVFGIGVNTSGNITVDSASDKEITLGTIWGTETDTDIRFRFTRPASPVARQRIMLAYRVPDGETDPLNNGWVMWIERNNSNNAWDFRVTRYSGAVGTNVVTNINGVGDVDALRVTLSGDDHTWYTGAGTEGSETWTQRSTTTTNTTHNTAARTVAIYTEEAALVKLTAS
jgi:hypothetical protein